VKERIDNIRDIIGRQIPSLQNPLGCLSNDLDEYIEAFDDKYDKLKARLQTNREARQEYVKNLAQIVKGRV